MIDSHCHLDYEPLINNLEEIIKRSKDVGIEKLLTICTTLKSFEKIKEIVNEDEIIFGTYGIHPHESKNDIVTSEIIIREVNKSVKIIGIGETGLDFFYNNSDKKAQIDSFNEHIKAAIKLDLPIIVHSRSAEKETYEVLNNYKNENPKILMHCFTGSLEFAKKLLKLNTFFSASGIITFKNSLDLQYTFKQLPMNRLLIETDSPFLAPDPFRGKKNEPSFIIHTLKKLSDIKNTSVSKLDRITSENFNKLFF